MQTNPIGNILWITPRIEHLTEKTKIEEKTEEQIYGSAVIMDNNIKFDVTCDCSNPLIG